MTFRRSHNTREGLQLGWKLTKRILDDNTSIMRVTFLCFALGAILIWGSAVLMMGWHAVIAVLSFHSPLYSAIMLLIATGPWLYLYYAKNKRR